MRRRRFFGLPVLFFVAIGSIFIGITMWIPYLDLGAIKFRDQFQESLNWTTQWWKNDDFFWPIRKSTSDCPLCNFTATQISPSSSEADAVITVVIDEIHGLPTTIRSMRTAGIRSPLIVFADTSAAEKIHQIQSLIDACGVNIINIGELSEFQLNGRYRTRWHLIYDYLRINPHKFRRVVFTDAYDSFFQGDVFLSTMRDDTLYFSTETINITACRFNKGWLKQIWPDISPNILAKPIICAGPVAGGVLPLLELCRVMFDVPEWISSWRSPPDQAFLNYLIWGGHFKAPHVVVPNDGFMTTVGYCNRSQSLTRDTNGNVGCPGFKTIPMLLHQYGRPKHMRKHIHSACPSQKIPYSFKSNPYSKASF